MRPTSLLVLLVMATGILPTAASERKLGADEARADLAALYEGLEQAHVDLFRSTPRSVFDEHFRRLWESLVGPISEVDHHRQLQRFVALAGHAHARIEGLNPGFEAHLAEGGLLFPLDVRIRDGAVIVVGRPEGSGVEPGEEILALGDLPNAIWLSRLTRNLSAETPELAYSQLERLLPYLIWLEFGASAQFEITVTGPGGTRTLSLDAVDYETYRSTPLAGGGPDLRGRAGRLLTDDVAYLRPGHFYDIGAATPEDAYAAAALHRYVEFVDSSFEAFIDAGADTLVLDLRDNGGGDASYSDPVVAWIADEPFRFYSEFRVRVSPQSTAANKERLARRPEGDEGIARTYATLFDAREAGEVVSLELDPVMPRSAGFEGEVYVLVDASSYSNAVTTAALIQDYGFGEIVDEPTADMATTFGAMERFELPHSSFRVGYPKAHVIRPNGEASLHPLTPDVVIEVPLFGEGDVMLERLLERIERVSASS